MSLGLSILAAFGPTYGNYGGLDYTGGVHLLPGQTPDFSIDPIDDLDSLFRQHDMDSRLPGSLDRAVGDLKLMAGIALLPDASLTPEGHLYAAGATLAMLGDIAIRQHHPELLTPEIVVLAAGDALDNLAQSDGADIGSFFAHVGFGGGLFLV